MALLVELQHFGFSPGWIQKQSHVRGKFMEFLIPHKILSLIKPAQDIPYGTAWPQSWCGFVGDELRTPSHRHVSPRGLGTATVSALEVLQRPSPAPWGPNPAQSPPSRDLPVTMPPRSKGGAVVRPLGGPGVPACSMGQA